VNRKIKRVIVHCSATADKGDRFGVSDVDLWHRQRGWKGVGYHWVIRRSGVIEPGRHENQVGAHTLGHNTDSIGVCYMGSKYPTADQIRSFLEIYQRTKRRFGVDYRDWYGHNDFAKTACPGFDFVLFKMLLKSFDSGEFFIDDNGPVYEFLEASALTWKDT